MTEQPRPASRMARALLCTSNAVYNTASCAAERAAVVGVMGVAAASALVAVVSPLVGFVAAGTGGVIASGPSGCTIPRLEGAAIALAGAGLMFLAAGLCDDVFVTRPSEDKPFLNFFLKPTEYAARIPEVIRQAREDRDALMASGKYPMAFLARRARGAGQSSQPE